MTLDEIEKRLAHYQVRHAEYVKREEERDSDWPKPSPYLSLMRQLNTAKEFIELGQTVTKGQHELIVNGKFIIAKKQKKWRVKGKNTWYYYKDVPTFVKKYILREEES